MKIYSLSEKELEYEELRLFLNGALERDFITRHMFERVISRDPNFSKDLVYLAYEGEELVGVLIGVYRVKSPPQYVERQKHVAWIKALAVPQEYRGKKIFDELLEVYLNRVAEDGKTEVRFSDFASWYFYPGLDIHYEYYLSKFLEKGFTKAAEVVDYEVDLMYLRYPERVRRREEKAVKEGIVFHEVEASEENKVVSWVTEKFSACWGIEASMAIHEPEGGVWIAEKDGEILGFSVYGGLEPNWFGPIGVDPKARGKGLGTILLYKCLESLRLRGYRYIIIPWTNHLFFYTQLEGVKGVRHYWILKKELK